MKRLLVAVLVLALSASAFAATYKVRNYCEDEAVSKYGEQTTLNPSWKAAGCEAHTVRDFTVLGQIRVKDQVIHLMSGTTLPNSNFSAFNKKSGTNKTSHRLEYDATVDETTEWEVKVGAVAPTTVAFDIVWMADTGTPGQAVYWYIVQDGVANDEPWDAAGTTVSGNDVLLATGDVHELTITGTPTEFGANETTHIGLTRDADHASDNLSGDSCILDFDVRFD